MKKLFLGMAVAAASCMSAQDVVTTTTTTTVTVQPVPPMKMKEPVRFGIKGAATAAQFSEQELAGRNMKLGFNAGIFVNIPLSSKFALQPEALYNQMGAKSVLMDNEFTTGATTVRTKQDYSTTLNYISVPVMLQMKPTDNFYVEAGPEVSYFVDGKNKGEQTISTTVSGTTTTQIQSASQSIDKDRIKKFNLGFGLGLGYYFTPNLGINARYVNSLTHIYNNSDAVTDAQKNINTNRVFQLGLNYKF